MLLEVKNLRTHLQTGNTIVKAVDDVSFTINKGETYCLVGESGSGKSISALSIIQLLPSDIASHPSGQIHFDYRHSDGDIEQVDMLQLADSRKRAIRGSRIAMIFQEPMTSLNPVYTIGDQIIEALQLHDANLDYQTARARAIEALAQVQIPSPEERVDEYPHRLSGGQRQRVMIAMAMACEPDLLIADEPTTALDVTVQAEILRLMQELQQRRGMGILFITHDFGVVAKMAHRLGVMRLGKIVEEGPLSKLLHSPQHEYTKQLIAALPENLARKRSITSAHETHPQTTELSDQPPLLELKNVKVYFPIKKGVLKRIVGYVKAVDDVTFNIRKGRILALVGESGCGKTTLGRAIIRLINPTAGTIAIEGQDITGLSAKQMLPFRRKMQIIFQDPMSSLNPRLSIAATLTEPMAVHHIGQSKDERIDMAREILKQVQLDPDYLWRYPHEFSGGQRQRIGIARALVLNPKFIVCDEITSALDVSVQAEVLQLLLQLQRDHDLTLLFITHNIGVVEFVSDEMAVMYDGKIVEHGSTHQVSNQPRHEYTRKLLAAVPRVPLNSN